jgi:methanogen homocitrate synthase
LGGVRPDLLCNLFLGHNTRTLNLESVNSVPNKRRINERKAQDRFGGDYIVEATDWKSENWWVGNHNFSDKVRDALSLPKRVMIHDSTLRDGEQTPGVVFRKEDKVEIAKALDDVGVDRIETGMPAVSKEDQDAIRMISNLGLRAKTVTFCRATKGDIDLSVDCGADGVLIEIPCSTPKLKYQFKWDEQQVIDKSIEAILYAKEMGVYVTYFPYDTTRSDMNFLKKLLGEVIKTGKPDSIGIVDTMGCMLPLAMGCAQ